MNGAMSSGSSNDSGGSSAENSNEFEVQNHILPKHQNGQSSSAGNEAMKKLAEDASKLVKEEGEMSDDEDDIPLIQRKQKLDAYKIKKKLENHVIAKSVKKEPVVSPKKPSSEAKPVIKKELKRPAPDSDSDDDIPLSVRAKKVKKEDEKKPKKRDNDKKEKEHHHHHHSDKKKSHSSTGSPAKKKNKGNEELQGDVWKWWEDDPKEEGVKWNTLEHSGPLFAPDYEPLPKTVKFKYDGKHVHLSEEAEEVATFYARMLDHDYTTKPIFRKNFFRDWRRTMTSNERALITELDKCDFREMHQYFLKKSEERKAMSKEEKQKLKAVKDEEQKKYGFAFMDGYKQKIGNFRIEPPGLFRGRGEHPKMGMLKKRVRPEDVSINCSKGSKVPSPPKGHRWKEVRSDNSVTWLASWVENVLGQNKYVMLNPSSKIKGQKDWEKYETARQLKTKIDRIREVYTADFKSKEMRIRQRAVALYFIDRLALRAGNEKDDSEAADTVGCCSLRCEHITLHDTYKFSDERGEQQCVVEFDFLGKDSIRYNNLVPVEKRVYKNVQLFMENKKPEDDLFDRLDTTILNKHLQEIMPGLTAKVFRTYNASITLQRELDKLEKELNMKKSSVHEKLLGYNRANRSVAILCNHQRSVPKGHETSMKNLKEKIKNKKKEVKEAKKDLQSAKRGTEDKLKNRVARLKEQLKKLKLQETDKDEGKTIALGTSKLNYLDPRITVAWCKKNEVPVEKAYNKTQREKFHWAIEMAGADFVF